MLKWLARVALKSRIIDLLLDDVDEKLATELNKRIDVPGLDEEQEQKLLDSVIDVALDVLSNVLEEL